MRMPDSSIFEMPSEQITDAECVSFESADTGADRVNDSHLRCDASCRSASRRLSPLSLEETSVYQEQPVVLRSNMEDWNLTLCSSRGARLLQPECGMTTVLASVDRASRTMVIFTASHDERFHRTPAGGSRTRF
ncbi:hypothetical protein EYF80_043831 [Liparis tanakae]|uniref:Uncharacterized protein n=1 Tax=Liparis tanakae TaxID=230148 RepID=A0A4Z2FYH4_9TELE|nr:hypothetical protein EYF80_043831 [Liparis tanakae]